MAQFTNGQAVTHKQGAGTGVIIRIDEQRPTCALVEWTVAKRKGSKATKTFRMYMSLDLVTAATEA